MSSLADLKIPGELLSKTSPPGHLSTLGEPVSSVPPEIKNKEPVQKEEKKPDAIAEVPDEPAEPPVTETKVETPVTTTEVNTDPWEPIKLRFKDREPTEVLNEYETLAQERETLRLQLEERESRAKELQEKLVQYDSKNDPDYIKNVHGHVKEAADLLVEICGDDKTANDAYLIYSKKDVDPSQRRAELKAFLEENGISHMDALQGFKKLEKHKAEAMSFHNNYEATRAERQKQAVLRAEQQQKEQIELIRVSQRTSAFRAEAKLKEQGIDFLTGYEEARSEHLANVERMIAGSGVDQETETFYNVLGRMAAKNAKDLKAKLKRLDDLESAARSKPTAVAKEKSSDKQDEGVGKVMEHIYGKK